MIRISFEYGKKITSPERRIDDVTIHDSIPPGIISKDDRSMYVWNCRGDKKMFVQYTTPFFPRNSSYIKFLFSFE